MDYAKIMFQVIDNCNLSCIYCSSNLPYTGQAEIKEIDYRELILLMEYIKKYIPRCFYIQYIITGGEPSLYSNISKFLQILQKDTHKHDIYIRTNSFIRYDNIFNNISNVHFDMTYHYDSVLKEYREEYFNTILHNIEFLLKHQNYTQLKILSHDELSPSILDNLLTKYRRASKNNNALYEIRTARQTAYFTPCHNNYKNNHFNKNIYVYRVIKSMSDYSFVYGCEIASKYAIIPKTPEYNSLRRNHIWKIIQANLFKQERCNLSDCNCHICTL